MRREHRFSWILLAVCGVAAAARAWILWEHWQLNPFAEFPYSDEELYWRRAGEMAAGAWLGSGPFLIAPLYSHALGMLRAAGGGLASLGVAQTLIHLATAACVAFATRLRAGDRAGLLAAGLFLLLSAPALFATRVLAVTLQAFLAALLWWEWEKLARSPSPSALAVARAGVWLGLLCLAFPAALLLIPVYGLWLVVALGRGPSAALRHRLAALGVGTALLAVSPATLHNAIVAGEFVPVTAHAGVTLAHGNGPGAAGIYTPLDDVTSDVRHQHRDAALAFEREHGRAGSWQEIDAHFRSRVFAWWLDHPLDAAALFLHKLHWLASARHYDNVAVFALEREHQLGRSWVSVPLALPWLLGLALLGSIAAVREGARGAPALALVGLPALVCLLFYYSARYRLPAAPVVCGLAATAVFQWRSLPLPRPATALLALLPLCLLALDSALDFENLDFMREAHARSVAHHHGMTAEARAARGDLDGAEIHVRRALRANPGLTPARRRLYNLHVARGDLAGAAEVLEGLVAAQPADLHARLALAWLRASAPDDATRNGAAALAQAREALLLAGDANPEVFLVLALAEAETGAFDRATAAAERGLEIAAAAGDAILTRDLANLIAYLARREAVRSEPRLLRVAASS